MQDGFDRAVRAASNASARGASAYSSDQHLGHPEHRDRVSPPRSAQRRAAGEFRYAGAHNTFSVAAFVRRAAGWQGPAAASHPRAPPAPRCSPCAAHDRRRPDRRRARRRGGLAVPDDAVRFQSLQLTSRDPVRPFDPARDGLSIGEAAAFALLERTDRPTDRGRPAARHGRVERRHHMSARTRRAAGRAEAMRARSAMPALRRSRSTTSTSTAPAPRATMKPRATRSKRCSGRGPVQLHQGGHRPHPGGSRRAGSGHLRARTAGRADARRPQHRAARPALAVNYLTEQPARPLHHVLSNSFGFGGANCAWCSARA